MCSYSVNKLVKTLVISIASTFFIPKLTVVNPFSFSD